MVGDAQIGKTSLMVKYVEGTFDEDYIQTLGMVLCGPFGMEVRQTEAVHHRCEFHGEDCQHQERQHYVFNMGPRRSKRIHQYVAACVQ